MEKLIAQFLRLYLMPGMVAPSDLVPPVSLVSGDDLTRAIVIDFARGRHSAPDQHWTELCAVANRLQEAYGFPAPAVSITGASSFRLWLSLEEPVPLGDARRFLSMLRDEHFPELDLQATTEVELPPCLNAQTGKWAAFIHPGMGASFVEEAGLDVAPPLAAQLAFLEGLESIGKAQFFDALVSMKQGDAPQAAAPAATEPPPKDGLLLKDATLEDIVRHLHAMNIEPTFRHLLRPD
ncbi:hypothetical protein LK542_08055 [Massilia sp. IC2-477]|uniref:hypothetical protein n=1 Tax=Massilia sp. IC2-477 TaxID=2887198 RepID=UPI001D108FD8|nr:hypothetical protein [Massilia sp. IC2-477]MCC2955562.1 hypothetical protein [Massilia sp. IC2-477]